MSLTPASRFNVSVLRTCWPSSVVGGKMSVTCGSLISKLRMNDPPTAVGFAAPS
jgi:hypothetical protein